MKINQTFKNIKRLQQIGTIFASYGFQNILNDIGLDRLIPFQHSDSNRTNRSPAVRLRMAFEELGPTFIKLGQMLSVRPDLIPSEFVLEFRKLQDQVKPIPLDAVHRQITKELDIPLDEVFASLDPDPLGAASIAQAHRATLHDGSQVVVKVRRPGIEQIIETDLSILFALANLIERYVSALAVVQPTAIVEEFASVTRFELDFIREAQNIEQFHRNFKDDPHVVIPQVHWAFTGKRVLIMGFLDGIPLRDQERLRQTGWDLKKLANVGVQTFMKMVFIDGFFHGDIHGGNILVLEEETIGLIDFGIAGRLDDRMIETSASLFISLVRRDFEGVARTYTRFGGVRSADISSVRLARDLQQVLEPLMGLSLKQINSAELLLELGNVARRHRLQLPQELLLLFKAIITLDGMGRDLDPDFDVIDAASEFARTIVIERYKPERLLVDLVGTLRDMADLGRDLPSQLQSILSRAESGGLVVDARLRDPILLNRVTQESWRITSAILTVGGVIGLGLVSNHDHFGLAGVLALALFLTGSSGLTWTFLKGKGKP